MTNVLSSTTQFQKRHEMYLTEKHLKTLKQNIQKTLLIKGFSLREDGSIRIMDSTIVMNTAMEITVTPDMIQSHIAPPMKDIATIKTKSKGERVSLRGTVIKVTNVLETPSSRRRIVNIRDATGSIELKLWSQKVNLLSVANVEIEVTCVCVDQYLSRISLNSTVSTTVKILDNEEVAIEGIIEAACFEEDSMSVLIEDRLFYLDTEKILQIFRDLCFIEGTTIKARISGQEIVSILEVNGTA
uniref:Uncharacterized protein LOC111117680 n=1 Tax=Crassostrea virginica TaxID=6565 RepID=A0A8B8CBN4_CRAVI|nr:uncharacterized protein LOC111117680 [Crassostrea virginica]